MFRENHKTTQVVWFVADSSPASGGRCQRMHLTVVKTFVKICKKIVNTDLLECKVITASLSLTYYMKILIQIVFILFTIF